MNELTEHEMENEQDVGKELKLSICTPSKRFIEQRAYNIIQEVEDGKMDALELVVKCSAIVKMAELIKEGVQRYVLDDLSKHNGNAVLLGAKIERKETGVKYDYTQTPAWLALKAKEDAIAKERKELEEMLKKIPKRMTDVDKDTGDMVEYVPATKSSTTSFAVTLSKT